MLRKSGIRGDGLGMLRGCLGMLDFLWDWVGKAALALGSLSGGLHEFLRGSLAESARIWKGAGSEISEFAWGCWIFEGTGLRVLGFVSGLAWK